MRNSFIGIGFIGFFLFGLCLFLFGVGDLWRASGILIMIVSGGGISILFLLWLHYDVIKGRLHKKFPEEYPKG